MDVESAINLFFKGVLLFPIFLMAGYIGVTMMKHMIFHGIPAMNRPTPEQIERLQEQDSEIGSPVIRGTSVSEPRLSEDGESATEEAVRHHIAEVNYQEAVMEHRRLYREWVNCVTSNQSGCESPGGLPSFSDYYEVK